MKQTILNLLFALPLLTFAGCSSSDVEETDEKYPLENTIWEYLYEEDDWIVLESIGFKKETVTYDIEYWFMSDELITDIKLPQKAEGIYVYNHPAVAMSVFGKTLKGTISGNELTTERASGDVQVFTKK